MLSHDEIPVYVKTFNFLAALMFRQSNIQVGGTVSKMVFKKRCKNFFEFLMLSTIKMPIVV